MEIAENQPVEQMKKWYKKWWGMLIMAFIAISIIAPVKVAFILGAIVGHIINIFN